MSFIVGALLWLHILSAIGWMGGAMIFGMILGPTLPLLSPAARSEFILNVFPRLSRYVTIFTVITPVWGIATALAMSGGNFSIFAPTSTFGLFMTIGATLTLVTLVVAFAVIFPALHKVLHITQDLAKNSGPPPQGLVSTNKKLRAGATAVLILLVVILICMVAAVN